jgi:hypothetical protein
VLAAILKPDANKDFAPQRQSGLVNCLQSVLLNENSVGSSEMTTPIM